MTLLQSESRPAPAPPELFCPECGYDLRGTEHADRCPECGTAIDRSASAATSRIPWVHRAAIGRLRAYRRTFWLVTLRPQRLGAEAARPVGYAAARRFRFVTALIAALPPAALLVGVMVWLGGTGFLGVVQYAPFTNNRTAPGLPAVYDLIIPWEAGITLPPVMPIGFVLLAIMASGVAGYWFHPASLPVVRQNRAIALSQYGCAPMVWLWVPASCVLVCAIAAWLLKSGGSSPADLPVGERGFLVVWWASTAITVVVLLAWLRSTLLLLRATTHAGPGQLAFAAILIPLAWLACGALAIGVFPWVLGYVWLIVGSLA
jgi:hypothetical protein